MKRKNQSTPPDLQNIIAVHGRDEVVWSIDSKNIKIRYGLQVFNYKHNDDGKAEAAKQYGLCIAHHLECERKL